MKAKTELYVDFATGGFHTTEYGSFDLSADAIDINGNTYTVYWYFSYNKNSDAYDSYSDIYYVYYPALILNDKGEDVTSQCVIYYSGDDYLKVAERDKNT